MKDFYARGNNTISSECKECYKAKMRKAYKPKHKDGIYHDELGRPIEYKNGIKAYAWTPQMVSDLKRFYPVTKNEELADIFMMSAKTIWKKAKELGIEKDKAWLNKIRAENALIGGYATKRKHKVHKKREPTYHRQARLNANK